MKWQMPEETRQQGCRAATPEGGADSTSTTAGYDGLYCMEKKTIRVGCMFWNYLADRTQQLVKELWDLFEENGIRAKFFLGTENHFYMNEMMAESSKNDYQYSCLSTYSRYDDFDLLIVSGATLTISRTKEEAERVLSLLPKLPTIFLENSGDNEYSRSLVLDNAYGIRSCTEHLIKVHGCKKFAFIAGPKENQSAQERLKVFLETLREYGLTFEDRYFVQGNYGESVDEEVEVLFSDGSHPDAIVSANDEMALAVYRVARKHGLTIGKDVMLTGFDDISVAPYLDPPLTTVRQDYPEMAAQIFDLAMQMLDEKLPESRAYKPKIMIRGSCGCKYCKPAEDASVTDKEQLINSFMDLRNMRQRILSGASITRAMLCAPDRNAYREMIASVMENEKLKRARMLLLKPYKILHRDDPSFVPESVYVSIRCKDGICQQFEDDEMPRLELDKVERPEAPHTGCSVVFLLFFEEYQYGVLELQIGYQEIEHYYMFALEIGLGMRYLDLLAAESAARAEVEEKNRRLDYAAYHDALTTVFNRNGFLQQERIMIDKHAGKQVAVLMADLDHLKQINDAYGHDQGDRAIKLTANALTQVLGDYDPVIGRTGGDEFSAIFAVTDDFDPDACVESIHRYCEEFNRFSQIPYYLGISAGCLKFEAKAGMKLRELFKEADVLLYGDKKRRRLLILKEDKFKQ